jgi:hypothetical protein
VLELGRRHADLGEVRARRGRTRRHVQRHRPRRRALTVSAHQLALGLLPSAGLHPPPRPARRGAHHRRPPSECRRRLRRRGARGLGLAATDGPPPCGRWCWRPPPPWPQGCPPPTPATARSGGTDASACSGWASPLPWSSKPGWSSSPSASSSSGRRTPPRQAAAATVLIPLSLAAGASRALVARVDRLLVHTVSVAGLTAVVVAVFPRRRHRSRPGARRARALALHPLDARGRHRRSSSTCPARDRLGPSPTGSSTASGRPRRGAADLRQPPVARHPDGRAAPAAGGVAHEDDVAAGGRGVDRDVRPPRPCRLGARSARRHPLPRARPERPVLARAGVVGNAWLAVWAPRPAVGRGEVQLRVGSRRATRASARLLVAEWPPTARSSPRRTSGS